jgi:hypothetical protein
VSVATQSFAFFVSTLCDSFAIAFAYFTERIPPNRTRREKRNREKVFFFTFISQVNYILIHFGIFTLKPGWPLAPVPVTLNTAPAG